MTMTEPRVMDRDEILTRLADVNARAKAISRRGRVGTLGIDYREAHELIDWLLVRLGC